MTLAICDDETEYRSRLTELCSNYFASKFISVSICTFASGEELLKSGRRFDIILLDIEMDGINGIETAKEINRHSKNTVIFIITAYQKYLDDAMDLNVFSYIDKPVNKQRLYVGLDKALDYLNNNRIFINTRDSGTVSVKKSDIIYVEASLKKFYVVTQDNKFAVKETLKHFKEALDSSSFLIPHNSYIVNMNYITNFQRDKIKLSTGGCISIAPKKQSEVKHRFFNFIGEDNGSLSDDF